MSSKRGTRTYLLGWLDAMLSLTDIHTRGDNKKIFYSCDEYAKLDVSSREGVRFYFTDKGQTSSKLFTYDDIDGMRANYSDGIFSIVLNNGFCCKLRMWASDAPNTKKFVGFTIGDYFAKNGK